MKTAVLYIATGRYLTFWKDFFESSERYFLRGIHKSYFVFTDSSPSDVAHSCSSKVNVFHLDKYGHPRDTLYRFRTFLTAESELEGFDYIFFFNANVKFIREVNADILPSAGEGLVCALHPLMSKADNKSYPYERDSGSLAYIPMGSGKVYVQGALIGGTSKAFLDMSRQLKKNIDDDLDKGIVAVWHDESHLNRYILKKNPKLLGLEYLCPDTLKYRRRCGWRQKILLLEKSSFKYGGIDYIRGKTDKKIGIFRYFLRKVFHCA